MSIITFDCDEVLAELSRYMLEHHDNTFLWVPLTWDEIVHYHFENIPKIQATGANFHEGKKVFDDILLNHSVEKVVPVIGMQDIVWELKKKGHELYVVTARWDDINQVTLDWIEKHYPGMFSDVVFANHYNDKMVSKGEICRYLDSKLMFEDTIHNAESVAAENIPVIMPAKPWNTDYVDQHQHIIKVASPNEMKQILMRKWFL